MPELTWLLLLLAWKRTNDYSFTIQHRVYQFFYLNHSKIMSHWSIYHTKVCWLQYFTISVIFWYFCAGPDYAQITRKLRDDSFMLLESIRYTGLPLWDSLDPSIGCSGWMQHVKEKLVNIGLKKVLKAPWFWNHHKSICKQILNHPVCEPYLRCLVCRLLSGLHRLSLSGLCRQLCDLINTLSFPSSAHVSNSFGLSLFDKGSAPTSLLKALHIEGN